MVNATLTENQSVCGPGGDGSGGGGMGGSGVSRGGGIYNDNGTLRMLNTLIAGNLARAWTDLALTAGQSISLGHNLVGSVVTHQNGSVWLLASDILNYASRLEPLGDNGGPTPTHRLAPNSPAIDQGAGLAEGAPAFDQRGAARPQGAGVDIGAVEFGRIKQTIDFGPLSRKTYGDAPFQVSADASSGLPVDFSIVNNLHASANGDLIRITGAGLATVEASQAGDEIFFPAEINPRQSFAIRKAELVVTAIAGAPPTRAYGAPNPDFAALIAFQFQGFIPGDSVKDLDSLPLLSSPATPASPVGTYPLLLSGGSDDNYDLILTSPQSTLTVAPAVQHINFPAIGDKTYGDAPFAPIASVDSGLPLVFSVTSGPAKIAGGEMAITGAGTVSVTAVPVADPNYLPATAGQSFTVKKAPLNVKAGDVSRVFGQPNPVLPIVYSGFKPGETSAVLALLPAAATAATINSPVGAYPITVSGGSDANYALTGYQAGTLTIVPATQTISFDLIPRKSFGDAFAPSATTSSGLPVSFSVDSGPATVSRPEGSTITVNGTGTITIRASQAGTANYLAALPVTRTFLAVKAPLTVRADDASRILGQPNPVLRILYSGFKFGDTASVLDFPPTAATAATVSSAAGQYPITVAGGSDYFYELQGYLPGTLTIAAARQSIAFDPIAPKAYGDVFTLSAKADSGLPVSFAIENGPAAVSGPNGATLTVTNLGTILVKATQAGDANFLAALPVSQSFSVGQSVLGVAAANVTKVYGGPNPALPILYTGFKLGETNTILATQPVAVTAATAATDFSPAGTYPITVSGGSDSHYLLQGHQPGTLTITPAPQTIVFGPIPDKSYGDVFLADAVSSSGLPVTFSVASGPAKVSGTKGATITVTNQGIVTIKASQPGDGNFGAAADALRSFTVVKSVLTAKANDNTRRARQPNPAFEIVYSGFKLGETSAVLDVPPAASTAATAASAPGTYPIIVSGGADDHYDFLSAPGVLTVVPANTPPVVTLLSPLNGAVYIRPVSLPVIADATDAEGPVAQVRFFDQGTLVGSTNHAPFSIIWTNVPTGVHRVTALAVDSEGETALSNEAEFTVLEHLPFIVGIMDTNNVLMRQTGLFQQKVTITNPTPGTLRGIRLLIGNLPVGSSVHNATGNTNGVDYIQYDLPLIPGASVAFQIEYYVPTREVPSPTISTHLVLGEPLPDLEGTPVTILRVLPFQAASYLVEFGSEPNRDYYPQYSPDLIHWRTARPALRGNGSSIQWIDNGPPKTDSPPDFQTSRFYRIISVP